MLSLPQIKAAVSLVIDSVKFTVTEIKIALVEGTSLSGDCVRRLHARDISIKLIVVLNLVTANIGLY